MTDPEAVSTAYRELYKAYEDLSDEYRTLKGKYKILLGEHETLNFDYRNTLSILSTTKALSERQSATITNLKGEIDSLLALVADLRKRKNPLLNFTIDGLAGYDSRFFLQGGASWMPLQKGWFRAGIFGELGYVFFDGFAYRCGIKFSVFVFGD